MNKMRGFSLAEILICLAIIGVVSAFGATIMKKSTANAYKMYYRSGYENLYDALASIVTENADIATRDNLQTELNDIFDLKNKTTKNGIKYDVTAANGKGCFIIEMTVPQQKTRNNQNGQSIAVFMFNRNGDSFLIPMNVNQPGYVQDLQSRSDLISFYQDDGIVGKYNGHQAPSKISPMNYKNAVCQIYGDLYVTVPPKYVKEASSASNVWGDTDQSLWDFSGGRRARIVNCAGITKDPNKSPDKYSVTQYIVR